MSDPRPDSQTEGGKPSVDDAVSRVEPGVEAHVEPWPFRVLDAGTQALNVVGSLLIFALMLLIGADVLGRAAFNLPISGVPELVTLSIVAIVFLQIPQATRAGRLTQSEAVLMALRERAPKAALLLETLFDLAACALVGVIVWATWPLFLRSWTRNDFIGAIGDFTAPVWPVKAVILIGGAMLILQLLARAVRRFRRAP